MRLILALLLLLILAACSRGGGRAACPAGDRCLEVGNVADPQTLDPNKAQLVTESNILFDLMVGLTQWDNTGHVIPGLATSWETSPNGLTWTFHLRDARWSDGVPVTANDFVYSLHRLEDPATASPYAYLLYLVAGAQAVNEGKAAPDAMGVRALGPHILQLQLAHPAPYLPQLLVNPGAMPLPEHVVRRWGDAWVEPGHYVSDGPYKLKSWQIGEPVTLSRNPLFWDNAQVCFDQVRYYPTSDAVTAERRVASGELDIDFLFISARANYLRRHLPGFVHTPPALEQYYVSFNTRDPVLQDKRVRLALSMDIDRDFIATKLSSAGETALYNFTPPGLANYPGNPPPIWAGWSFPRRQAVARRLLAQAGYGEGHPLRLELKYPSGSSAGIVALQADWRTIGAEISLAPEEGQIMYADFNAGAFQLGMDSWAMDYDDPLTFLELLASSAGPQNHSHYANPRYDALLARADQEVDQGKRARILSQAEALAMSDVPVAPIKAGSVRYLVNPDLTGWADHSAGVHPKRYLCRKGPVSQ